MKCFERFHRITDRNPKMIVGIFCDLIHADFLVVVVVGGGGTSIPFLESTPSTKANISSCYNANYGKFLLLDFPLS